MRNAILLFSPNKSVPHHAGLLHHLSIVLFLLLSMGVGSGTATAQAQTRAYVPNLAPTRFGHRHRDQHRGCDHSCWSRACWVAITPDGTRAYVTNLLDILSVIATAINNVISTIPVG